MPESLPHRFEGEKRLDVFRMVACGGEFLDDRLKA